MTKTIIHNVQLYTVYSETLCTWKDSSLILLSSITIVAVSP